MRKGGAREMARRWREVRGRWQRKSHLRVDGEGEGVPLSIEAGDELAKLGGGGL